MLLYNLPAFAMGDFTAFLSGVARANHLVKRVSNLSEPNGYHVAVFRFIRSFWLRLIIYCREVTWI